MDMKTKFMMLLNKVENVRLGEIWNCVKKLFNFCWKAGLVVALGIAVIIIVEEVGAWCSDKMGMTHYDWCDEYLGDNIQIRYFSDETCATYDSETGHRISPKLKWISGVPENDSLTVFCDMEDKRGFLNVNTGEIVIEGQYSKAWHFSGGLAAVLTDNDKIGFINYDNELVIPDVFDFVPGHDYVFRNGRCLVIDGVTELIGAIDTTGFLKIPMEYSAIIESWDSDGMLYLRKDSYCGLADRNLNVIFDTEYDNVCVCNQRDAAYLTLDGVKQLVAFDGEIIQHFVIDETWPLRYVIPNDTLDNDEYATHPDLVHVKVDCNCHGVMNAHTGQMVIPAIYTDIKMISKDLIMVELYGHEDNNIVFDTKGKIVK